MNPTKGCGAMMEKVILLVEDNPDDIEPRCGRCARATSPTRWWWPVMAWKRWITFLAQGYAGRDTDDQPQVVLLDLKLPRVDGLEVLKRILC